MIATQGHFGPRFVADGVSFRFYASAATAVRLELRDASGERSIAMDARGDGWFEALDAHAADGTRYAFRIDDAAFTVPDPASRFQPDGVHGSSQVVDTRTFAWPDREWPGQAWNAYAICELHIGAFTPAGTYAAAIERLDELAATGYTAIEVMPLAATPGERNWGYDGVLWYAPSERYGTPAELRAFIAAAHTRGLAVLLDVVYNHFGPEGNYLHGYAPDFYTDAYQTPWGAAIDYERCDAARAYAIENARYWIDVYGFDGLRLDATQMIFDASRPSLLVELRDAVATSGQRAVLIVENDHNDVSVLDAGYDAQWNDDYHHAAHVLATGERDGYYRGYAARPAWHLLRSLTEGFGYQGEISQIHGGIPRGAPSAHFPLTKFVDFLQNHDQIGNRAFGERLAALTSDAALHAFTALLLLAPSPPLAFMGDEWAASTPFLFFCDFEPELATLVTAGRRREFAGFPAFADEAVRETIPDPGARETFVRSKLDWNERMREPHRSVLERYRTLLQLRRAEIVPRNAGVTGRDAYGEPIGSRGVRANWRLADGRQLHVDANLGGEAATAFAERLPGTRLYATHGERYAHGIAPPWAVRWTLE
jgi:malto-oligosyltrehalose trehalohydrolase